MRVWRGPSCSPLFLVGKKKEKEKKEREREKRKREEKKERKRKTLHEASGRAQLAPEARPRAGAGREQGTTTNSSRAWCQCTRPRGHGRGRAGRGGAGPSGRLALAALPPYTAIPLFAALPCTRRGHGGACDAWRAESSSLVALVVQRVNLRSGEAPSEVSPPRRGAEYSSTRPNISESHSETHEH